MKSAKAVLALLLCLILTLNACSPNTEPPDDGKKPGEEDQADMDTGKNDTSKDVAVAELPSISPGETATVISRYTDKNGDIAIIPAEFSVSEKEDEQTVKTGVVVIGSDGSVTGRWEEAGANNIYDLAGNNWKWTQERYGFDYYVMRGGGYNLMGGSCSGAYYPAALRDPLPGNSNHPNVTFRVALFVK